MRGKAFFSDFRIIDLYLSGIDIDISTIAYIIISDDMVFLKDFGSSALFLHSGGISHGFRLVFHLAQTQGLSHRRLYPE